MEGLTPTKTSAESRLFCLSRGLESFRGFPLRCRFRQIFPRMPAFCISRNATRPPQLGIPHHEAYVSTQQPPPQAQARLPWSHANPPRARADQASPHQGPPQPLSLRCAPSSRSGRGLDSEISTAARQDGGSVGSRFSRPEARKGHRRSVSLQVRASEMLFNATGRSAGSERQRTRWISSHTRPTW